LRTVIGSLAGGRYVRVDLLDVDEVCLPVGSHDRFRFLKAQGYREAVRSDSNRCFTRGLGR